MTAGSGSGTDWRQEARKAAIRHGIDPGIYERQIGAESGFNPNARSPAGATGIAQFMPATARGMGINPNDPHQALDGGARLMAGYVKKFGSYSKALTAYNAGPGAVGRYMPAETSAYIAKILGGHDVGASGHETARASSAGATQPTGGGGFDQAGFHDATKKMLLARMLASSPDAKSNPLLTLGLLSPAQVTRGSFEGTGAASTSPSTTAGQTAPTPTKADTSGQGTAEFGGKLVAKWIAPILEYGKEHGWQGGVNSGFRSLADQTRIYNSGVRPAAKPGTSNHEFTGYPGGAVDVSSAAQLSAILSKSKYRKLLVWAGAKDPVHFSHPHGGSY